MQQKYINISNLINGLEFHLHQLNDYITDESQVLLQEIITDLNNLQLNKVDLDKALEADQNYQLMDDIQKAIYKDEMKKMIARKIPQPVMDDLERAKENDRRVMNEQRDSLIQQSNFDDSMKLRLKNHEGINNNTTNFLVNTQLANALVSAKLNNLIDLLQPKYTENKFLLKTVLDNNNIDHIIREKAHELPKTLSCDDIDHLTGTLHNYKKVCELLTAIGQQVTIESLMQNYQNRNNSNFMQKFLNSPSTVYNSFKDLVNVCRRNRGGERNR